MLGTREPRLSNSQQEILDCVRTVVNHDVLILLIVIFSMLHLCSMFCDHEEEHLSMT